MLDLQSELQKIYAIIQAEAKEEEDLDLSEDEAKEIIKSVAFSAGALPCLDRLAEEMIATGMAKDSSQARWLILEKGLKIDFP